VSSVRFAVAVAPVEPFASGFTAVSFGRVGFKIEENVLIAL
jgi:hypothetical protein